MSSGRNHWDVPLSRKNKDELDLDLIEELNQEEDPGTGDEGKDPKESLFVRAGSLMLALIMLALVLGRLLNIVTLPSLEFLTGSRELAQNPGIRELQRAVVSIDADGRRGTGFNIHPSGIIVTNFHVIEDARTVSVSFPGERTYPGEAAVEIPQLDMALLSIKGEGLPVLEMDGDEVLRKGDRVLIIGNPLGLSRVVVEGEVEGYAMLKDWDDPILLVRGPVHRGSSGSPVFNSKGSVVAVIFATLQKQEDQEEEIIGLAVPVGSLMELIKDLPGYGLK